MINNKRHQYREITMIDIAKELKIAKSTVSRALTNHRSVAEKTRKAVLDLVEKYNYQPNAIALSLTKKATNTIGVIVPIISSYFFSSVISGIEEMAHKENFKVIICQSAESYEREVLATKTLQQSKVDGILVSMAKETQKYDHFKLLKEKRIPLVFFDRLCPDFDGCSITVDNFQGAFDAVEHLIFQGCGRIAHFSGPASLLISQDRLKGYAEALARYGIPFDESLVFNSGFERSNGIEAAKKMLKGKDLPDAIFAVCDPVAIGAMLELKRCGIRVPEDIAIVGFNDDPTATVIEPRLTTIGYPASQMGESAARFFFNQINSGAMFTEKKVFNTELIIRESSIKNLHPQDNRLISASC